MTFVFINQFQQTVHFLYTREQPGVLSDFATSKTVGGSLQFDNEKFYLLNYVLLMCTPTTTLNIPLK